MSNKETTFTFYQHLQSILSANAHTNFVICGEGRLNQEFSSHMLALPKLNSMSMMFMTQEFNPEVYSMFEGETVRAMYEDFVEDNLNEDEYNKLKQDIFRVKRYGK